MIDVSIITVNYYSIIEIIHCYESVVKFTPNSISYEFIVVSNSDEADIELDNLKKRFANLSIINSEKNIGFGQANNLAANQSKGKYLFFLNPDTQLINDCLTSLMTCLESDSTYGIVGPAVYSDNGKIQSSINNFPSFITMISFMLPFGHLLLPKKFIYRNYSLDKTSIVPVIQGSSIFMPKLLFDEVDGFSKQYFMYSEETDLCKKISNLNRNIVYLNTAKILHIGGVTTATNFDKMELEKHKSKKKYIQTHKPNLILFNRIAYSLGYFFRFLFSLARLKFDKAKYFFRLMNWYIFKYS